MAARGRGGKYVEWFAEGERSAFEGTGRQRLLSPDYWLLNLFMEACRGVCTPNTNTTNTPMTLRPEDSTVAGATSPKSVPTAPMHQRL